MLSDNIYVEQKQDNGDVLLVKTREYEYAAEFITQRLSNGNILLKRVTCISSTDDLWRYNLQKSKIQHASIQGTSGPIFMLDNPSFKTLYELVHDKIRDGAVIIKHSVLNIKTLPEDTKGYSWYPLLGISVQGVDANKAMLEVMTQCQKNKFTATIQIKLQDERLLKIRV